MTSRTHQDEIISSLSIPTSQFKHVEKPTLKCLHCQTSFVYEGVMRLSSNSSSDTSMKCGLICPLPSCGQNLSLFSLLIQLTLVGQKFIQKYYDGYLICDEPTCHYRTRKIPLKQTHPCPSVNCQGSLRLEVSS
jgi:DNA polymerase alpha subunit A